MPLLDNDGAREELREGVGESVLVLERDGVLLRDGEPEEVGVNVVVGTSVGVGVLE